MNKKHYSAPTLEATLISQSDILLQSDVLIDGSDLFGENND